MKDKNLKSKFKEKINNLKCGTLGMNKKYIAIFILMILFFSVYTPISRSKVALYERELKEFNEAQESYNQFVEMHQYCQNNYDELAKLYEDTQKEFKEYQRKYNENSDSYKELKKLEDKKDKYQEMIEEYSSELEDL